MLIGNIKTCFINSTLPLAAASKYVEGCLSFEGGISGGGTFKAAELLSPLFGHDIGRSFDSNCNFLKKKKMRDALPRDQRKESLNWHILFGLRRK